MENSAKLDELIERIDRAVEIAEVKGCCHSVKDAMEAIVRSGEEFIPAEFLVPAEGKYARRLLYRAPGDRYTILVMVWDEGQGTAIHDHAGFWCVECVYRGRIKVVSYDLVGEEDADSMVFTRQNEVHAGLGEAGALIPPFDYHTIENECEGPAVTIHIYGGELTWCHVFVPIDGDTYRREVRELSYTASV